MIETTAATTYVVVCRGPHCREKGSLTLRKRLVHLLKGERRAQLIGYACFGRCDLGPNVAFFPEGEWYGGLAAPDAAERVVRHATVAQPIGSPPLDLPSAERTEHLRNINELIATIERDRARPRRRWWFF
ncbi:MAG TPA: (2Fe-2S) ferredoxin domain-containing protein [Chloroflexota bacterium]|nr:(2Fe-2S) ferredoxin domain-containing protein [Chloroflexota bacterium]